MAYSEINRIDKTAPLLGYTTNGLLALNVYSFENYSFDKLFLGTKGSGKSACLKALNEGMNLRGNHVSHIFDIHGEYTEYALENGYKLVSINADKHVNFTQIFFVEQEDGIIRENDIQNRISTMVTTFESINDFGCQQTLKELSIMLNTMYRKRYLGRNIDTLTNEDWFLLEEIYNEIEQGFINNAYLKVQEVDMNNIRLGLKFMVENYGYIFNKQTNLTFDLNESICFDISFLANNSDTKMVSSYVSLLLNYVSNGVYLNLHNNKRLAKELDIDLNNEKEPLITHELIIDETKKYLDNKGFVTQLLNLNKFQRKAYSGTTVVFHTLHDVELGEENNAVNETTQQLQQLFGLFTNKFIGKIDSDSLKKIPKVLTGVNESDCDIISHFKKNEITGARQFFLKDDRDRKTVFTSIVTKYQRTYFGGGN